MLQKLTPERYHQLASQVVKLDYIVEWNYEDDAGQGHALIHLPRDGEPAIAMDWNGYEYAVRCGLKKRDHSLAWFKNGVLTHTADDPHQPVWVELTEAEPTHRPAYGEEEIEKRIGAATLSSIKRWMKLYTDWHTGSRRDKLPPWLFISGAPGVGKSETMKYMKRALAANGVHARMHLWRDLVQEGLVGRKGDGELPSLKTPISLIDDVGADNASAFAAELLYVVTDAAEQAGRALVFTANLDTAQLLAQYRGQGDVANGNAARAVDRIERRSVFLTVGH